MRKLRYIALALAAAGLSLVGINADPVGAVNDDYNEIYYIGYQPGGGVRACDWYQGGDGWFPTHNSANWTVVESLNCTVDFTNGFHIRVDGHGSGGQVAPAILDIWVGAGCDGVVIRESGVSGHHNWGLQFLDASPNNGSCVMHGLHTYAWHNVTYVPSQDYGRINLMEGTFDGFGNAIFCDQFGPAGGEGWIDYSKYGTTHPGWVQPVGGAWLKSDMRFTQLVNSSSGACNNNGWAGQVLINPYYHYV